jgi:hypothetical protein
MSERTQSWRGTVEADELDDRWILEVTMPVEP